MSEHAPLQLQHAPLQLQHACLLPEEHGDLLLEAAEELPAAEQRLRRAIDLSHLGATSDGDAAIFHSCILFLTQRRTVYFALVGFSRVY